ncbi:membrane protein [Sporocytophaga myxococcoides]|uniref:Membrane protein n=1 Tax=Sporocytophaga myxococcoides TaxID=153721 RepID=A0A098LIA6_9BACT|nr:membrane protein [Sporocytophaga myxococcoides]GAL86720.1 membrane protein [Sporocytophaga myxococcoides]
MKPLIVLLSVFLISIAAIRLINGVTNIPLAGRMAMAAMLAFTAVGHFVFTKGMSMMLPDFVPFKTETIYLTGLIEIAAALGLLIPGLRHIIGWLLIVFFLLLLPANIYAAFKHVDYQKGTFDGPGMTYLWFRVPLQLLFILWTYFSSIRF